VGVREWKLVKKIPWLKPAAWMYAGVWELGNVMAEYGSLFSLAREVMKGKRRAEMMKKLYE
jgi:hypothetical protein